MMIQKRIARIRCDQSGGQLCCVTASQTESQQLKLQQDPGWMGRRRRCVIGGRRWQLLSREDWTTADQGWVNLMYDIFFYHAVPPTQCVCDRAAVDRLPTTSNCDEGCQPVHVSPTCPPQLCCLVSYTHSGKKRGNLVSGLKDKGGIREVH